jgi:hypothetical protein
MIDITDYAIERWNKKVIFAANATGKTRACNKLYEKICFLEKGDQSVQIMNSSTINDLVKLSGKIAYIGLSAKESLAIDNIENYIDKLNSINKVFKLFDVANATNLSKKSLIFSLYKIKNSSTSEFLNKLNYFKNVDEKYGRGMTFEEAKVVDNILNEKDYNFILELDDKEKQINYKFDINNKFISSIYYNSLVMLKNYIYIKNIEECPLCGTPFANHQELLKKVNDHLATYTLDETKVIFEEIDRIYMRIGEFDPEVLSKYEINIDFEEKDYAKRVTELIKFIALIKDVEATILRGIKSLFSVEIEKTNHDQMEKYKEKIEKEQSRIKDNQLFYEDIKNNFNNLVVMPPNLELVIDDNKLWILNDFTKCEISKILSDSEIKRLALAVLKAQIDNSVIEYIILDDPVDSYDDYFLRKASEFICEMINASGIKWTIMTHLFEAYQIFSKNLQGEYVYYQHDMNYKYTPNTGIPVTRKLEIGKNQIEKLQEHELIISARVLEGGNKYKMDKVLASLAITNTARNFSTEIFDIYSITYVNSKINKKVTDMENRYIHYSSKKSYRFFELMQLYKKLYRNIDCVSFDYSTDGNIECEKMREELLSKNYYKIQSANPLIKEVYMKMIKVSYCKYEIERKLICRLIKCGIKEKHIEKILKGRMLYNKLSIANDIINESGITCDISDIWEVFLSNNEIINNFSHGTTRMFPPYLSVGIYDISKMEYYIERLEE